MKRMIWHNVYLSNPGDRWHSLMKDWAKENREKEKDEETKSKRKSSKKPKVFFKKKGR
jgi:hypothetical protein